MELPEDGGEMMNTGGKGRAAGRHRPAAILREMIASLARSLKKKRCSTRSSRVSPKTHQHHPN